MEMKKTEGTQKSKCMLDGQELSRQRGEESDVVKVHGESDEQQNSSATEKEQKQ